MIRHLHSSIQSIYGTAIIFCQLLLFINLPMQEGQQNRQLVPGKPIVRDLAGVESHSYQMPLAVDQYVRVVIDQRGIDVVVKLIGPDGKQVNEFDSDSRVQGQEIASWVSEKAGTYRLEVSAKNKVSPSGQYVIQAVILRVAKEDERSLDEAGNMLTESRKLFLAGKYDNAIPLLEKVREIREKVLGAEHPETGYALNELARLYLAKGDLAQALIFRAGANYVDERNLNLTAGTKRKKFEDLELFKKRTDITLSLQYLATADDQQILDLTFTTLLRRKARELDATIDTLDSLRRQAQDKEPFERLADARMQLAELRTKEPDKYGPESFRQRVKPLEDKVDEIEAELSARSAIFRANTRPVTLDAIRAELPSDAALVEFAYFIPVDLKTEKAKPPRYLAYVLAARGNAKWTDLGEAAIIDQAVNLWREALHNPNRPDVNQLGRTVDEKVMQPVRSLLGNTRRLMIAPDGSLNLIPFAALVDEKNQYLIERYSISYLTTGRDLLRLQTPQPSKGDTLVLADPDFGSKPEKDPAQLFFRPLHATAQEALAIKDLFPSASVLQAGEAAESALKQARGPRILHIATRSFFFENQDAASAEGSPSIVSSTRNADSEASKSNPFTVQFEATPAIEIAEGKVKALSARGVDAYVVKGSVKGKGDFYRVRAGNFPNVAEAQKYGAELQKKGVITEFFVTRYEEPPRPLPVAESLPNPELSKFAAQIKNPLLRAGLALAGANQSGLGKSGGDEGLLTAMETAYLDLSGTKLVVLTSCDTGVGEMKDGEGFQGLRRALVIAGSESQVISLWPISDEAVKDVLVPYYKTLQQGVGRSEGLRQAQLRMVRGRKELHHPFFWAALLPSGEWANLEGSRQ
jgi:CHAT domain-containing protein